MGVYEAAMESSDEEDGVSRRDKKLVFLSKTVLDKVRQQPMVTGTQIALEIFELYKTYVEVSGITLQKQALTI